MITRYGELKRGCSLILNGADGQRGNVMFARCSEGASKEGWVIFMVSDGATIFNDGGVLSAADIETGRAEMTNRGRHLNNTILASRCEIPHNSSALRDANEQQ